MLTRQILENLLSLLARLYIRGPVILKQLKLASYIHFIAFINRRGIRAERRVK